MFRTLLIAATLFGAPLAWTASNGFFGFALRTDFNGSFWNPVLSVASISQVAPDSSAARNGLAVGDVLLEIEGISVPGAKSEQLDNLKLVLKREAHMGDQLSMKLRRANGKIYSAVLVAEPRKE